MHMWHVWGLVRSLTPGVFVDSGSANWKDPAAAELEVGDRVDYCDSTTLKWVSAVRLPADTCSLLSYCIWPAHEWRQVSALVVAKHTDKVQLRIANGGGVAALSLSGGPWVELPTGNGTLAKWQSNSHEPRYSTSTSLVAHPVPQTPCSIT
jgi:hypothetical protein